MQKGSVLPLVLIPLLLLSLIGASIYFYYQQKNNIPQTSPAPSATPASQQFLLPSPSVIPDQTANWLTYTNEKRNYQIKYPNGWEVLESGSEDVLFSSKENDARSKADLMAVPSKQIRITIYQRQKATLEEETKLIGEESLQCMAGSPCKGRSAEELVKKPDGSIFVKSVDGYYKTLFPLDNDPKDYLVIGNNYPWKNEDKDFYNQITATFKFLSDETTNWKTFENDKFGYSFEYPISWELEPKDSSEKYEVNKIGPRDSYGFSFVSQYSPIEDKSILNSSPEVEDVNISFSNGKIYKTKNTGVAGTKYRVDLIFEFSPFYHHVSFASWMEDEQELDKLISRFISKVRLSVH